MRFSIRKQIIFLLLSLTVVVWGAEAPQTEMRLVNLKHLNHLYERITVQGQAMAIVHIYSEYPDYAWVDANGEGIACVDDAARAAVVYLRHFGETGEKSSLAHARKLIDFCRFMQTSDGQFYNFIYKDHTINRTGKTSFKSFGWWAARGVWAIGEGFSVFQKIDPAYAEKLKEHLKKSFGQIENLLKDYPQTDDADGFKVPKWLMYHSAADATSELMLGLAAYEEASGNKKVLEYLRKFAEGLIQMQIGDKNTFPFGAHLSWQNVWHGWGNAQTQALARVAALLKSKKIEESAVLEVNYFYPFLLERGYPYQLTFAKNDSFRIKEIKPFSQIAYALRPAITGSLNLFTITGNEHYAQFAGQLATWFFGNNPAHRQMYDPQTGRCFDGILSESEINQNSGAESTIEALYSLLEVEANEIAVKTLKAYLTSH